MRSLARPNKLPRASAATVLSDDKVALGCRSSSQLPRVSISWLSLQTLCWQVQSMLGTMISRRKRRNQQSKQIHNVTISHVDGVPSVWRCLCCASVSTAHQSGSFIGLAWLGCWHALLSACMYLLLFNGTPLPGTLPIGGDDHRPPSSTWLPALSNVWLHCAVDLLSLCPSRHQAR